MNTYKVIFRVMFPTSDVNVIWGDVFEFDMQARSYSGAQAKALAFVGVRRSDVVVCKAN